MEDYSKRAKEQWGQIAQYQEFEEKTKGVSAPLPSLYSRMSLGSFFTKGIPEYSRRRKVYFCEWNAHVTKQLHRKLLSSFYLKKFPFSP